MDLALNCSSADSGFRRFSDLARKIFQQPVPAPRCHVWIKPSLILRQYLLSKPESERRHKSGCSETRKPYLPHIIQSNIGIDQDPDQTGNNQVTARTGEGEKKSEKCEKIFGDGKNRSHHLAVFPHL